MQTDTAGTNVIPFARSKPTIKDRPLMLSDLYLFIGIAAEAAREEGVPFEEMFAAVVMDELAPGR